jgi:lipid II isoglutaminyl synthase (glutamine-hydrolysing)
VLFAAKVTAARATARLSRLAGAGGGTTLPGRVLLALAPDGITRLASGLESGAVVISATNGKTTTAAMLAAILDPPLRVCHNRAGANLASGVASALVAAGDAAVGVFEVDEAALPSVAAQLDPSVLVLGNLFRDQLDRYGELELIGERWSRLAGDLPADRMLVRNGDDPLLGDLNAGRARTLAFGIADPGAGLAEMPHAADSKWCRRCGHRLRYETVFLGHLGDWRCPNCDARRPQLEVAAAALELDGLRGSSFDLHTPLGTGRVQLPVPGVYNLYNALAASAAACATGTVSLDRIVSGLERFNPPFGRFERLRIDHAEATLLLVKNPAGANEVIRTLRRDPQPKRLLIALNDRIADGRDVSWIWDVDFELLTAQQESIVTTGTRAAEMALRLKHAGADEARMTVVPALADAVAAIAREPGPVYVLATYTAMLELRRNLAERGIVRPYWEAA